jgi:hypothetical protein
MPTNDTLDRFIARVEQNAHVEEVVKATWGFATTARRLKVRNPGSLQKVCADVRRRTGLLSA